MEYGIPHLSVSTAAHNHEHYLLLEDRHGPNHSILFLLRWHSKRLYLRILSMPKYFRVRCQETPVAEYTCSLNAVFREEDKTPRSLYEVYKSVKKKQRLYKS